MKKLFVGLAAIAVLVSGCATQPDAPEPTVDRRAPCRIHYPLEARQNGWQGPVVVKVKVEPDGMVSETSIAHSSGHDMLDQEALRAARCMRYQPARIGGIPQAGWMALPFRFVLPR